MLMVFKNIGLKCYKCGKEVELVEKPWNIQSSYIRCHSCGNLKGGLHTIEDLISAYKKDLKLCVTNH